MILDCVENISVYEKISPAFATAMAWLSANWNSHIDADRVDLSEDVYVLHKSYDTKDEENCHYEAHRDYVDVQLPGEHRLGTQKGSD